MVRLAILIAALVWLEACGDQTKRAPAIGTAYAGPATLNVREDIALDSPVVAKVKHGERLEIIQHRRRFFKVRTTGGVEGWADEHLLLSTEEIERLRAFEKDVETLPSQGAATTYESLNVHTEPDRQAPSFIQLKENEKFDVIAHRAAPRLPGARKPLVGAPAKKAAVKKKPRAQRYPPPPMPAAPRPPANWREMSATPPEVASELAAAKQTAAAPVEDWSLIRTPKGESGWVLTSRVFMLIPDEVAQYAEGKRITSYFSLDDVRDGDKVKHTWLWTTVSESARPYDFDSLRVFIWSLRRHRYETAYIERNLRGYFPVKLETVKAGAPTRKGQPAAGSYPGFSVCVDKKDGGRYRRSYAYLSSVVRFVGESKCEERSVESAPGGEAVASSGEPERIEKRTIWERVKGRLGGLRKRWFGK